MKRVERTRVKRQEALARREKDVVKLQNACKADDVPEGTLKKLDRAKQDVLNLYAKLGLKNAATAQRP